MTEAARNGTADQLYGDAFAKGIPQLSPAQLANVQQFASRIPADVTARARRLAQLNGVPLDDSSSLLGLHWTKKTLDGLIAKESGAAGDPSLLGAYTGLKTDLMSGMRNLSPEYDAASNVYADMSKPLDQMRVAQQIADKSVNPLTGILQPYALASNVSDATVKRVTGMANATLDNTMTNQQNNLLQGLLADVQRSNAANNLGRGAGSDTAQKLAYGDLINAAGGRPGASILASAISRIPYLGLGAQPAKEAYADASRKVGDELAATMLDPKKAAAAMRAARALRAPGLLQATEPYSLPALGAMGTQAGLLAVSR